MILVQEIKDAVKQMKNNCALVTLITTEFIKGDANKLHNFLLIYLTVFGVVINCHWNGKRLTFITCTKEVIEKSVTTI